MAENNQVLVYDLTTGSWVGVWEGLPARMSCLCVYQSGETARLVGFSPEGDAWRMLVPDCWDDNGTHPGMVWEQGYEIGDVRHAGAVVEVDGEHHHGAWTVLVAADGVNEVEGPHLKATSATRLERWGAGRYDLGNIADNQMEAGRENYAVLFPRPEHGFLGLATHDGHALGDAEGNEFGADGAPVSTRGITVSDGRALTFGVWQEFSHQVRLRKAAKSILVRVATARGAVALKRVGARASRLPFGRRRR